MGSGAAKIPLGLLGGGLVAWAVADSGFVYLTATKAYASGALIDAGWFLGYLLILIAARRSAASSVHEDATGPGVAGWRSTPPATGWGSCCPMSPWPGRWP